MKIMKWIDAGMKWLLPELLYNMWDHIHRQPATRNDFMSHSSYQVRGVLAVMGFWALIFGSGYFAAGAIGGILFAYVREEYDRRTGTGWCMYDYLGASWGWFEALAIVGFIVWAVE